MIVGKLEAVFAPQDVLGRLVRMEKSSLAIELDRAQRHLVECVVGDEQALMHLGRPGDVGKQSIQLGQSFVGEGLECLGPMTTHDQGAAMRPANKGAGQMVRVGLVAQEVVVERAALEHGAVDQIAATLDLVVHAQARSTRRPGVMFVEFRLIQFHEARRNTVRGRYFR